jgi:hypothetical protein
VNRTAGLSRIEQNRDNFFLDRLDGGLFEVNGNKGTEEKKEAQRSTSYSS